MKATTTEKPVTAIFFRVAVYFFIGRRPRCVILRTVYNISPWRRDAFTREKKRAARTLCIRDDAPTAIMVCMILYESPRPPSPSPFDSRP